MKMLKYTAILALLGALTLQTAATPILRKATKEPSNSIEPTPAEAPLSSAPLVGDSTEYSDPLLSGIWDFFEGSYSYHIEGEASIAGRGQVEVEANVAAHCDAVSPTPTVYTTTYDASELEDVYEFAFGQGTVEYSLVSKPKQTVAVVTDYIFPEGGRLMCSGEMSVAYSDSANQFGRVAQYTADAEDFVNRGIAGIIEDLGGESTEEECFDGDSESSEGEPSM